MNYCKSCGIELTYKDLENTRKGQRIVNCVSCRAQWLEYFKARRERLKEKKMKTLQIQENALDSLLACQKAVLSSGLDQNHPAVVAATRFANSTYHVPCIQIVCQWTTEDVLESTRQLGIPDGAVPLDDIMFDLEREVDHSEGMSWEVLQLIIEKNMEGKHA
jgi:hypothetical protein